MLRSFVPASRRLRALALTCSSLLAGCQAGSRPSPAVPDPVEAPAPAAANSAPEVTGDFLCVGPRGTRHVFPLRLADPEGDRLRWRAEAAGAAGELYPRHDAGLASPASVEIVYEPPGDRADEAVIVVTVADAAGAETVVRLTARSGTATLRAE